MVSRRLQRSSRTRYSEEVARDKLIFGLLRVEEMIKKLQENDLLYVYLRMEYILKRMYTHLEVQADLLQEVAANASLVNTVTMMQHMINTFHTWFNNNVKREGFEWTFDQYIALNVNNHNANVSAIAKAVLDEMMKLLPNKLAIQLCKCQFLVRAGVEPHILPLPMGITARHGMHLYNSILCSNIIVATHTFECPHHRRKVS